MKYIEKIPFTYTTQFVFPLLNIDKSLFYINNEKLKNTRFINAYLNDTDIDGYNEGYIYIAHHNYQDTNFKTFEDTLTSLDNYVDGYDICNGLVGVKIFEIPDEFKNAYSAFLKGTYSTFDKAAVHKILTNNFDITSAAKKTVYKGIFEKADELRKLQELRVGEPLEDHEEVWAIFNLKTNILNSDLKDRLVRPPLVPASKL